MDQIHPDNSGGAPVTLHLGDILSDERGKQLLDDIARMVARGNRDIRIDLKGLDNIDSRGCAWLIRAVRAGRASGGCVTITGAHGRVAEFIELIHGNFDPPPCRRGSRKGCWSSWEGRG